MYLHYLAKLDMLIGHVLPLSCYRKKLQNLFHLSQAGSCRHCGSHLSLASLIAPDQWCMFCSPSLAIFPTCVINWIKSGEFAGHS